MEEDTRLELGITSTGTDAALPGWDEMMGWESPGLALLQGDAQGSGEKRDAAASAAFLNQHWWK